MKNKQYGNSVALVEESETSSRPTSGYLIEKYYLAREVDASTCSGDRFYDIFDK